MDVTKMIAELREEHGALNQAIGALEALSLGGRKRRGRPPKWTIEAAETVAAPAVKRRGRPVGSKNKPRVEEPQA